MLPVWSYKARMWARRQPIPNCHCTTYEVWLSTCTAGKWFDPLHLWKDWWNHSQSKKRVQEKNSGCKQTVSCIRLWRGGMRLVEESRQRNWDWRMVRNSQSALIANGQMVTSSTVWSWITSTIYDVL